MRGQCNPDQWLLSNFLVNCINMFAWYRQTQRATHPCRLSSPSCCLFGSWQNRLGRRSIEAAQTDRVVFIEIHQDDLLVGWQLVVNGNKPSQIWTSIVVKVSRLRCKSKNDSWCAIRVSRYDVFHYCNKQNFSTYALSTSPHGISRRLSVHPIGIRGCRCRRWPLFREKSSAACSWPCPLLLSIT